MTPRWRRRPDGSTWGDFGENDELGRLNLIGPEQVRRGVLEVRDGRVFSLSLPLSLPGGMVLSPHRYPPVVRPSDRFESINFNRDIAVEVPGALDVVSDDFVVLHTQYSTQWDAFGHVGSRFDADGDGVAERVYYNGWRAGFEVKGPTDLSNVGLSSLADLRGASEGRASTSDAGPAAISSMAVHGVQGRAVLVDLEAHLGTDRTLVTYEIFSEILASDDVVVEEGDILVLHTGLGRIIQECDGQPTQDRLNACAVLDGGDPALQSWITSSGVAAIAADNFAVEAVPSNRRPSSTTALPLHELCLFRLGVHLGELWWLSDLAAYMRARQRSRFLLTAPPLRLPGSVGSPVTPIATV